MSVEDTELTFIHCPSCRSLVPAVATRCRMCGYLFDEDSNSKQDNGEPVAETSKEEENDFIDDHSEPVAEDVFEEEASFLEELESGVVEDEGPMRFSAPESEVVRREEEPAENFVEDEPAPKKRPQRQAESQRREEAGEEDGEARPKKRRRRRRKKKPTQQQEVRADEFNQEVREEKDSTFKPPRRAEQNQRVEEDYNTEEFSEEEVVVEPVKVRQSPVAEPQPDVLTESPAAPIEKDVPEWGEDQHLCAWFVNFSEDPRGKSIELRTGKYFIGKERLRMTDIIINDQALSTPHLLVKAEVEEGLIVQDLMSEQGTSLRPAGKKTFAKIFEPVKLSHGDTLRLGEYELTVCILPRAVEKPKSKKSETDKK